MAEPRGQGERAKVLADQLTLSEPGRTDSANYIISAPPQIFRPAAIPARHMLHTM